MSRYMEYGGLQTCRTRVLDNDTPRERFSGACSTSVRRITNIANIQNLYLPANVFMFT